MRALEIFLEMSSKRRQRGIERRGKSEYVKSILVHIVKEFNSVATLSLPNPVLDILPFPTHDGWRSRLHFESLNRKYSHHPFGNCRETFPLLSISLDIRGECLLSSFLVGLLEGDVYRPNFWNVFLFRHRKSWIYVGIAETKAADQMKRVVWRQGSKHYTWWVSRLRAAAQTFQGRAGANRNANSLQSLWIPC